MDTLLAILTDPRVLAIVSPLLVAAMKKITDKLPNWSLPLISTALGALISTVSGGDPLLGAGSGLAGVGVREFVDQSKKKINGTNSDK